MNIMKLYFAVILTVFVLLIAVLVLKFTEIIEPLNFLISLVVAGCAMVIFLTLMMVFPDISRAISSGLKRLPWILFTAGLLALGVVVGWTNFGFIIIFLLGVSTLALFGAMAIAATFKRTNFGRKLSDHILKGFLYAVAFMRHRNKMSRTDYFNYYMPFIQDQVIKLFGKIV